MITNSDPSRDRRLSAYGAPRGRKSRTADCNKCVIMSSLRGAGVRVSTIQAICDSMWLNRVQRRQILYSEGNGATHLYAIRSGKVKLLKSDASGRPRVTAVLQSGDLFGFEAIFGEAYGSFAEALTDCELCLASADQLKRLVADVPQIATDLARYLHEQLSRTRARQVAVTATGASAKMAGFLLHSLTWDDETGEDEPTVARDLTLSDIGGILGMSPETACRVLSNLKASGIVETRPTGILIRDVDSLRRMARL
jgi:CRP-like cAMP-binding protein